MLWSAGPAGVWCVLPPGSCSGIRAQYAMCSVQHKRSCQARLDAQRRSIDAGRRQEAPQVALHQDRPRLRATPCRRRGVQRCGRRRGVGPWQRLPTGGLQRPWRALACVQSCLLRRARPAGLAAASTRRLAQTWHAPASIGGRPVPPPVLCAAPAMCFLCSCVVADRNTACMQAAGT